MAPRGALLSGALWMRNAMDISGTPNHLNSIFHMLTGPFRYGFRRCSAFFSSSLLRAPCDPLPLFGQGRFRMLNTALAPASLPLFQAVFAVYGFNRRVGEICDMHDAHVGWSGFIHADRGVLVGVR